ncbi:DUF2470 domain-containing protein [Sphaerisporangium sp. TRM90804]|uniref:DUF2470 domain-containing protein n=1 Tax=Sphaerisporangium sp. TRM90804 TaxID=3031113 RepID=UPI00244D2626|nr:DUF2470 domain-containing protein [Sphaerisporangium sp. TRM90804]MDH2429527.1 DUF2470 domain-containing protein [Sphaerisporangium sp. TRM90804]
MHVTVPPITERVRSLAATAVPTHVSLDGSAHAARGGVDDAGRPLLLVKPGDPLHGVPDADDVVVTVDLAACRTLGGADQARGLLKVHGWAQAVPRELVREAAVAVAGRCPDEALFAAVEGGPAGSRLFRVDVGYVIYLTGQESGMLDAEDYLGAGPDPLLDAAERMLGHVNESHRDQLQHAMRVLLGHPVPDVWLWELDRYGATVRSGIEDPTLIRLPWPSPVDGPAELERALACLLCPHGSAPGA